jgi:hypothetical protein
LSSQFATIFQTADGLLESQSLQALDQIDDPDLEPADGEPTHNMHHARSGASFHHPSYS